jgi:hypothetical protein
MIRLWAPTAALFALFALPVPGRAQTVEEFQRQLSERDATIRELRKKIEALEREAAPATVPPAAMASIPRDYDVEELGRALERTLVQQGGLLLPAGVHELQPELSYAHWDKSRGPRRYELVSALSVRSGLAWQSQFFARVPYAHVADANASASAWGDVDLGISKQLAREHGARPGVVASLGWTGRTGRDGFDGGAATGTGFNVLQAGLTAVKRHDPLLFYGGFSYAVPIARDISGNRVSPGDALGVRLGGLLAASPETALNLGLNIGFIKPEHVNGQAVADSDTVLGTLQIGVGTILTRSMLLNISGEFRVTGNVPNFRLTATLPVRF